MIPGQDGVVTSAEPILRKTAKRDIIRYGPFTLPASKVCLFNSLWSDVIPILIA